MVWKRKRRFCGSCAKLNAQQMRWLLDNRYAVDAVATVISAVAGTVRYDWQVGDLSQAGDFESRWKIVFDDNTTERTQPSNSITVEAA